MARKQTDPNSEQETIPTELSGAETIDANQPNHTLSTDDQDAIREYLLGQLTDDRQQEVEERLLTEDDFFEELEIGEAELADEFLAGELTKAERAGFEQYFSRNPERQQNLRFAQVLKRNLKVVPTPRPLPWWRLDPNKPVPRWNPFLRAAAAVAAIVIVALMIPIIPRLIPHRTSSPQTFADITLSITTTNRAEGVQATKVRLPLNADALRITLRLPDSSAPVAGYRVELENENGEKKPLEIAAHDAQSVLVIAPAKQLGRGQYALRLFAINAAGAEQRINGNYFFTVE